MSNGPYQNEGETVYATELVENRPQEGPEESDEPQYKDKEWLHYQYTVLKKSTTEIGDMCDVSPSTILRHLNQNNIEARSKAEGASLANGASGLLWDGDWLREQYVEKRRNGTDIADELDVSNEAVYRALRRQDVEIRSKSESLSNYYESKYGDEKYNNKTWLKHQYVKQQKSANLIAEENGWHTKTVQQALDRHGIKMRSKTSSTLNRYKKSKCQREAGERVFVSSDGLDMSWRDITEVDKGCYIPYRDPKWLNKQVSKGLTLQEIVEKCPVDCCTYTIRKWIDKHGIERENHPNRFPDVSVKEMRETYSEGGVTHRELADEYDISRPYVTDIVNGDARTDAPGPIKGEDYE